jgi:hypothetical protein
MPTTLKSYLSRPHEDLPEQINIENAADEVYMLHEQRGGATFNLHFADQARQRLYSVCVYPERSRILTGKSIPRDVLTAYIRANLTLLTDPRCCVGTWYNVETDRTYLDVSVTVTNKRLALSLAKRYNQEGIFDLFRQEYIDAGGTGDSPENMSQLGSRLPPLKRRGKTP